MYKFDKLVMGIYEKALPKKESWSTKVDIAKGAGYDFIEISIDESDERLARLDWNNDEIKNMKNLLIDKDFRIPSMTFSGQKRFPMGSIDAATEAAKIEVLGLLKQTVRPEFINRIDEIVMFTPLTSANIAQIVSFQLKSVTKMLAQQGIVMDATPEAIVYLSEKGYDPQFGARPVKRVIQREVLNELSKEILSGKITADSIILIDAFDGKLVFRNQSQLVS